jgi:hemolysin III
MGIHATEVLAVRRKNSEDRYIAISTTKERSPLCGTRRQEFANVVTHSLGVLLGMGGLIAMLSLANGETTRIVSAWVFGGSLILLYGVSTVYHILTEPRGKAILQWLDHVCIYLLIAGSYTPLTLISIPGNLGWGLLATVWVLAFMGILLKTVKKGRRNVILSILVYVGMGWLVLVALKPVAAVLGSGGVAWIVAGGVLYTVGTLFYMWKRLTYHHAVWHLFVVAGSACHLIAVLYYVMKTD